MPRRLSGASSPPRMSASILCAASSARVSAASTGQCRTRLSRSRADWSMSCCFIVSTHQAKSEPLRSGFAKSGFVRRTRSIGILVNLAIDWLAFSRSELTIGAASSIDARNALMTSGWSSANVATVLKCHRRRQFRNVTGRYGAAVGAAETSHIAAAPTAAAELAVFAAMRLSMKEIGP